MQSYKRSERKLNLAIIQKWQVECREVNMARVVCSRCRLISFVFVCLSLQCTRWHWFWISNEMSCQCISHSCTILIYKLVISINLWLTPQTQTLSVLKIFRKKISDKFILIYILHFIVGKKKIARVPSHRLPLANFTCSHTVLCVFFFTLVIVKINLKYLHFMCFCNNLDNFN